MIEIGGKLFDWDINKAETNLYKHGVTFEEAASVFFDEYAIEYDDEEHSQDEDRFIVIGKSRRLRLLVVCHCYRNENTVIRIISARKASKTEAELYGGAL